jgi:hypothetical protein
LTATITENGTSMRAVVPLEQTIRKADIEKIVPIQPQGGQQGSASPPGTAPSKQADQGQGSTTPGTVPSPQDRK